MKIFVNKNGQLRSGYKIFFVYLLFMFISTVITVPFMVGPILKYVAQNPGAPVDMEAIRELSMNNPWPMLLQQAGFIAVPLLFWKLTEKKPISAMGMTCLKKDWKHFIIGLVFGIAAMSAVVLILVLMGQLVITNPAEPQFSSKLWYYLLMFIGVGFGEEIIGRGYNISVLAQTKNKWVMIIVSSIIFAVMHALNPNTSILAFVNLFLVGALFAYMFLATKNIWMPIGYHITWNFFQGNVYGIEVSGLEIESIYKATMPSDTIINGGAFGAEGGLVVTAIIAISFIVVWYFWGKEARVFSTSVEETTA